MVVIYLIWALLSIALIAYFFYLCYHAVKLFYETYGRSLTIILIFGLLAFKCGSNSDKAETDRWQYFKNTGKAYKSDIAEVEVSRNALYTVHINVSYYLEEPNGPIFPVEAVCYIKGITAGVKWKPTDVFIHPQGQKMSYEVIGTTEWSLLGFVVFSNGERFTGMVPL